MLNIQLISIVIFLLISLRCVWRLSAKTNSIFAILTTSDIKLMFGLTIIYAVMNLVNLGDFTDYSKPWVATDNNQEFDIKLNHPKSVSNIYYQTGLAKGEFVFSVYQANNKQLTVNDKGATLGYKSLFKWNKIEVHNQVVSYIKFRATELPMEIDKIVILDSSGDIYIDYNISDSKGQDLGFLKSNTIPKNVDNTLLSSTIFDEIYYATSAYQYTHGISPDIWVHPQLSMLLITLAVLIFGMNPFAWRFMPALCSVLMVPIIYVFAKNLFKNTRSSVIATLLLMFEFMHLIMGKMADIDNYVTLFLLLEYMYLYMYYQSRLNGISFRQNIRNLFLTGIFLGLAISCKWSGFYSGLALLVVIMYLEIYRAKNTLTGLLGKFGISLLCLVLLPLAIYVLVYFPYEYINHTSDMFELIIRYTKGILEFNLHSLDNAVNGYASHWWGWPLGNNPVSLFFWSNPNDSSISSSVAIIANPFIIWCFYPMLIWLIYLGIRHRDQIAIFILLTMLAQFTPYILLSRISFFYYFYSTMPFLILAIAYVLHNLFILDSKFAKSIVYGYVLLCIGVFVMYLPLLYGIEFPRSYVTNYLLWSKAWNV